MPDTHSCPRCGTTCEASGELSICGNVVPLAIFSCDHCEVPVELGGEVIGNGPFIFCITSTGEVLDGMTFDPITSISPN